MTKLLGPGEGNDRLERAPSVAIEGKSRSGLGAILDAIRSLFTGWRRNVEVTQGTQPIRRDQRLQSYPNEVIEQFASGIERMLNARTDRDGRIENNDASQAARDIAEVIVACVVLWALQQPVGMDFSEKEARKKLVLQTLKTIALEKARDVYSGGALASFKQSLEHRITIGFALSYR